MMHIANGNYKEVDEDQDKREAQWKNMMVERIFSCTIEKHNKKAKDLNPRFDI
jgi:ribosomal protein L17